jgi:L-histidine N-alpha-methyltransferase
VQAVVGDPGRRLAAVPLDGRRLVFAPVGTIGCMAPAARMELLARVAGCLSSDEHLLLGADLVEDQTRLEAAYDDAAGVSAAFNLNVLSVLNRELDADFDHRRFEHVVRFDEENEWTELLLRSRSDQIVSLAGLGLAVAFREGEEMRTGIRAAYPRETLAVELEIAGLEPARFWTDSRGDCALVLARPAFRRPA